MTEAGRTGEAGENAERIDCGALVGHAQTEARKVALTAGWILQEFDAYYIESRGTPRVRRSSDPASEPRSTSVASRRISATSCSL